MLVAMPRQDAILTPSQLNTLARDLLEGSFPNVLVEGEIGNLARPASGHLYFTLKDARAQVRCALFKPKSQWLTFTPREGTKVVARGRLTLYEARGEYQMVLDTMEEAGEGALRRAYEALKAKLADEGLFDAARKRPLPALPRRIAVLTSPSGAVIRDIVSVLRRRFPLVEVELLPVPVQGDTAAAHIRQRLEQADRCGRYDVLVLARGGGSLEDLWAFNDEALARAIAACQTPVVSAVGHETDFSLSDYAADLRAPTPSAAAELLVPDAAALLTRLHALHRQLHTQQANAQRQRMQRLDRAFLRLQPHQPQARLAALNDRAKRAQQRLQQVIQQRLQGLRYQLQGYATRPQTLMAQRLQHDTLHLRGLARSLHAISPLATVARGYSILQRDGGSVVRTSSDVHIGETLTARISDGQLRVQLIEKLLDAP